MHGNPTEPLSPDGKVRPPESRSIPRRLAFNIPCSTSPSSGALLFLAYLVISVQISCRRNSEKPWSCICCLTGFNRFFFLFLFLSREFSVFLGLLHQPAYVLLICERFCSFRFLFFFPFFFRLSFVALSFVNILCGNNTRLVSYSVSRSLFFWRHSRPEMFVKHPQMILSSGTDEIVAGCPTSDNLALFFFFFPPTRWPDKSYAHSSLG